MFLIVFNLNKIFLSLEKSSTERLPGFLAISLKLTKKKKSFPEILISEAKIFTHWHTGHPTLKNDRAVSSDNIDICDPRMSSPTKRANPLKGRVVKSRHSPTSTPHGKGWEDFGGYMSEKTRKLREKFASEYKSDESSIKTTDILSGVTIWVDGFTRPGREELRHIVGKNGGHFEVYPTGRITHVIAETLATATRLRLSKSEGGRKKLKVVTPAWVVESVAKGKKLPEAEFAVKGMTDPRQKSISSFFRKKS